MAGETGPFRLTFDDHVTFLGEPGWHRLYTGPEVMRYSAFADDYLSTKGLWRDEWSHTFMLRPSQLDPTFVNSQDALPYTLRLSAMTTPGSALANKQIWEQSYQQNANNPWIFHSPVGPNAITPYASAAGQPDLKIIDVGSTQTTTPSVLGTGNYPEGPVPGAAANSTDMQVLCWTKNNLPANCPMFLRWHVGPSSAGHATYYCFFIGDVAYLCGPTQVEIFLDTSGSWSTTPLRIVGYDLFSPGGDAGTIAAFGQATSGVISEYYGHDRSLLVLPFHQQYVYLVSSFGKSAVAPTRGLARRNMANTDWDITEGNRKMYVATLCPGVGWFQAQKVKFFDGPAVIRVDPFVIDYTPGTPLTIPNNIFLKDDVPPHADCHAANITTPPTYTRAQNPLDGDCATFTSTLDLTDQTRKYGMNISLAPGYDDADPTLKIYTPQLYGYEVRVPQTTQTWSPTAVSIQDVALAPPSAIVHRASLSVHINRPTRFTCDIVDRSGSLAAVYYRSYYPLLFEDRTGNAGSPLTLFLGVADPNQTNPQRLDTVAPNMVRIEATGFDKWLTDAAMRDTRDWTGERHIHVMQFIAQLAGVGIAGWDGPPDDTATVNNLLGGLNVAFNQGTAFTQQISSYPQPLKPVWRPNWNPPDSFMTYMKRIAENFSGWDFGLHPDGTFYYHDYNYYNTSEVTFQSTAGAGRPNYLHASVRYRTVEPDANVVVGVAGQPGTNSVTYTAPIKDWGSLQDTAAVNYLGKPKLLVFALPGALTCEELYKCAQAVFHRARRRHRMVAFRAQFVPTLKVGHCCTLSGISGVWRVQGYDVEFRRNGWDMATYQAELVEAGWGR